MISQSTKVHDIAVNKGLEVSGRYNTETPIMYFSKREEILIGDKNCL